MAAKKKMKRKKAEEKAKEKPEGPAGEQQEKEREVKAEEKAERAVEEQAEEQAQQEDVYIYVYGIVANDDTKPAGLDMKGLRDKPIRKIAFKDIAALTSEYPTLKPVLDEAEAMQHAAILSDIAKEVGVIPMSFGMVFRDEEILETILSTSYAALKKTLELIEGKIELGVKVVGAKTDESHGMTAQEVLGLLEELNAGRVKEEILKSLDRLSAEGVKKEVRESLARLNAEEVKQEILVSLDKLDGEKVKQEVLASLDRLSVKSKPGDRFSERLLLNHAFLVEKSKFSDFSTEVAALEQRFSDFKFIYTGPWPVYSFVDLQVGGS